MRIRFPSRNGENDLCHVISHWEKRNKEFPLTSVFKLAEDWPLKRQIKNVGQLRLAVEGRKKWARLSVLRDLNQIAYRIKANRCLHSVTGRKKIEAKWLARTLRRKWGLLPLAEIGVKKISFWTEVVVHKWGRISRQTPGKESGNNLGQEEEPIPSSKN